MYIPNYSNDNELNNILVNNEIQQKLNAHLNKQQQKSIQKAKGFYLEMMIDPMSFIKSQEISLEEKINKLKESITILAECQDYEMCADLQIYLKLLINGN